MRAFFSFKKTVLKILTFLTIVLILHEYTIKTKRKIVKHDLILKWIVVTSINQPTKQIYTLSKQSQFKLLIIGDLKTNSNWSFPNVRYLNTKHQKQLEFKSLETTPFNSYTRKNIGYLYAIQNGAKYIYDTDDDNEPIDQLINYFDFESFKYELEYDTKSPNILNPFAHFGQPTIWPRGYPLTKIEDKISNNYILSKKKTSLIQQGVVNGDPDVDAIFRLTKSNKIKRFNIKFDDSAPSVRIPLYKLTPFNSQNTLFHYESFWSLYLPHTVSFRLTDIWRSYWSQRLLWLLNSTISYHGPNVYQLRNSHSYLNDFQLEQEMYLRTADLVKFLYKWKCKFELFYLCVIDLSLQMAEHKFWHSNEVESIKNWLADLTAIGYKEPKILNFDYEKTSLDLDELILTNKGNVEDSRVKFTPIFQTITDMDNYYGDGKLIMKSLDNLDTLEFFDRYCSPIHKLTYNTSNLKLSKHLKNITLVITFNMDVIYENVVFLKHFYQSYFKNIVFCGFNFTTMNTNYNFKKFDSFTFIEYDTNFGYFHYYCMSKVIDINFKTDGILLMSDDVLLKYWNLDYLNVNKFWFFKKTKCDHVLNSNKSVGIWMDTPEGREALNKSFNQIYKLINSSSSAQISLKEKLIYRNYVKTLVENSRPNSGEIRFCWMGSDIFYVPRNLFVKFNLLVKLFRKHRVFLEIAVPTILSGLNSKLKLSEIINGTYYWNGYYEEEYYEKTVHFAHPFKLTHYSNLAKRKRICETFIQEKLNDRF